MLVLARAQKLYRLAISSLPLTMKKGCLKIASGVKY